MGFKFMHAADIHLDSPLQGLERYEHAPIEAMRGATRQAFENLVSTCLAEEVEFLLLAGDLYDGQWRDFNTALYLAQQLGRLQEADIPVFIVLGNHDAECKMVHPPALPANVKVFPGARAATLPVSGLPVVVHGQSYARTEVTDDLAAKFPKGSSGAFNVGLLHTSADGSASEHKPYAPCTVQSLVDKGYQYWALGHVHRRAELATDPLVVFPGNLQGRHIREAGPKGATLVTVDDDLQARAEHRDMDVVRWHRCDVSVKDSDTPDAAIDGAVEALAALRRTDRDRPLAVRVRLAGQTRAHRGLREREDHWARELRGRATSIEELWVEKVRFETQTPIDLASLREQRGPLATLLGCLDEHRKDPEALQALGEILAPVRKALTGLDDERVPFEEPADLRAILDDVEQMLIPMLLDGGRAR